MKSTLIRNLVRPLSERLGTAMAVWLVADGWNGELVQQFVAALGAVVLVSCDLVFARINAKDDA